MMSTGFGVDEVDTFRLVNCPLPQLPLSVILHRTSIQPIHHNSWSSTSDPTSDDGSASSSNSGGPKEVVSEVRSLRIESSDPMKVSVNHLKTLFNGLESVEKLSLINIVIDPFESNKPLKLTGAERVFITRQRRQLSSTTTTSLSSSSSSTSASPPETTIDESELSTTISGGMEVENNKRRKEDSRTTFSPPAAADHIKLTTERTPHNDEFSITSSSSSTSSSQLSSLAPTTSGSTQTTSSSSPPIIYGHKKDMDRNDNHHTSDNNSGGLDETDLSSSSSSNVPLENLAFSLFPYFPKLKGLLLEGIFPSNTSHNSQLVKDLLKNLNQLENVQLRNNRLKRIPNYIFTSSGSTLKRLYLNGNSIETIETFAFNGLRELQILDLFNNDLRTLPDNLLKDQRSLEYLRLGRNEFEVLPENLLQSTPNLKSLDLNLNRNLRSLPVNLLRGVSRLQNLTLVDSQLQEMSSDPTKLLSAAVSLQKIEMRGNRFGNLTARGVFGQSSQLMKIDVSYNEIKVISPSVFTTNSSSLEELNLYANDLKSLEAATFHHLKNLRILKLGYNNLETLSPELLFSLKRLEELDLSRNKLFSVNPQRSVLPFGLGTGNLHKLNFAQNNLTDFTEFTVIDWSLYLKISEINLSANKISGEVTLPIFYSTSPRVILDLSSNQVQSVGMSRIIQYERGVLQVSADERIQLRKSSWKSSSIVLSQVIVHLDGNPLKCDCRLEPFVSYANSSATDLEAAFRGILNRVSFDFFSANLKCAEPQSLSGTPLHQIDPLNLTCPVSDQRICPTKCSCSFRTQDAHLKVDCRNKGLTSIPEILMTGTNYRNITIGSSGDPSSSLTAFNTKVKRVSLLLSNNRITRVDPLSRLFSSRGVSTSSAKSHESITYQLYLDNNRIESLPEDFLQWPTSSQSSIGVLSLRKNRLSKLPVRFLDNIQTSSNNHSSNNQSDPQASVTSSSSPPATHKIMVSMLFLGDNPYNCTPERVSQSADPDDCSFISLKSWLARNQPVVQDVIQIKCSILANSSDTEPKPIIELSDLELCPQLAFSNDGGLLILSIVCILLSLALLLMSILYYRNKHTVLAFIYIHVNPIFLCLNLSEEDLDEDKLYDAFVSYSSADRDLVMEMIEKLEKPSDISSSSINFLKQQSGLPTVHEGRSDQIVPDINGDLRRSHKNEEMQQNTAGYYTLCVHERDWLPGNLISWNIVNSVQNSRRTILILSKEFIQSIWFQVEFHTAYYQMLEDKMDRLIVVVRGELPPKEQLDKDLVFLLTTKTYLTWGEKWFWEKLRYALPHRRSGKSSAIVSSKVQQDSSDLQKDISIFSSSSGSTFTLKMNGHKAASKSDLMKEYVDQTISDHFQLQASKKTSTETQDHKSNNRTNNSKSRQKEGQINDSFVVETET